MARFHIVSSLEAPDLFAAALADARFARVQDHPFTSNFARLYYPAVLGEACRDFSFLVVEGKSTVALVLATAQSGRLDYFGQPAVITVAKELDLVTIAATGAYAVETLNSLGGIAGCQSIALEDDYLPRMSAVGEAVLKFSAKPSLKLHAMADVSSGEDTLRQGLRKSFRSLINWGKRELVLSYVNSERPLRADFDAYHAFHRKIAGRETRSQASWDVMFGAISSGQGELVLAHLSGSLVAGTMFIDGKRLSYYASGVYDREQFDKPLAHWPLWTGLLRVPKRGLTMVDLGYLPLEGEASDKEINIGYFKRGFATHLEPKLVWEWKAGSNNAPERT